MFFGAFFRFNRDASGVDSLDRRVPIFVLSFLFCCSAVAYGEGAKAPDVVRGPSSLGSFCNALLSHFRLQSPLPIGDSVRAVGTILGAHGGQQYKIMRTGQSWEELKTEENWWYHLIPSKGLRHWFWERDLNRLGVDPQGDPRWFVKVYGEYVASFFGFKVISDTEMLVPDLQEFNAAVDKFNELAKKSGSPIRLPLKGYAVKSRELNNDLILTKFVDLGEVPVGQDRTFFHDLNYHLIAQSIPPRVVDHARRQSKAVLDFEAFLNQTQFNLLLKRKIKKFIRIMKSARVSHTDVGIGSYTQVSDSIFTGPTNGTASLVRGSMGRESHVSEVGLSPAQYLQKLTDKILEWDGSMPRQRIEQLLEQFVESQRENSDFFRELALDFNLLHEWASNMPNEMKRIIDGL